MNTGFFKQHILPHLLAILGFMALAMVYNHPLIEGKTIRQGDIKQFKGMAKGQQDFRDASGEPALWAHRTFSGMPGYQIILPKPNSMAGWKYIHSFFKNAFPKPAGTMALYFIGFYLLMLALGLDIGLAVAGALAFGLSSYNLIILEAGHMTKAYALGYAPMVLAGVVFTFRSPSFLIGAALTGLAFGLELLSNHVQITYYLGYILLFYGMGELFLYLRRKEIKAFLVRAAVLLLAAGMAIAANSTNTLMTSEYTPATIRGKSELTSEKGNRTSGLDKDYILNDYSYGILETFNLMIPNLMGGASTQDLGQESEVYKTLTSRGVPRQSARQFASRLPAYFGPQRFTSGPVYVGAVVVFLFVLGLMTVKNQLRWWLLAVTVLAFMLAWGKHFRSFSEFFIDYVPLYNKFRTVSMTLVIAQITMPLLGFMGLREIMMGRLSKEETKQKLVRATAITGGICLLFGVAPGMLLNFSSQSDAMIRQSLPEQIRNDVIQSLMEDRKSLVRADAFRSLGFILLAGGVLYALSLQKLKGNLAYAVLALLIVLDMWTIDRRYLNEDNYVVEQRLKKQNFPLTAADQQILKDKDPHFRVFNLTVSPFNDATTSYYHRSIGGYHGAKLRRYQELIEYGISPDMQRIQQGGFRMTRIPTPVLDMLDCRYIIAQGKKGPAVVRNPDALGPAWLAEQIDIVPDADAEIKRVSQQDFQPSKVAVIDNRFIAQVRELDPAGPKQGSIKLTHYAPDTIRYDYQSEGEQFAVFSEVYYNSGKGWQAYIDGAPAPHARVNYTLRGMGLPAGEHEITFIFEPQTLELARQLSLAGSLGLLLLLVGGSWHAYRNKDTSKPEAASIQ